MTPTSRDGAPDGFRPIRVMEVDLGSPLPRLPGWSAESSYNRALLLVRLHDEPVGGVHLAIPPSGVSETGVAAHIWEECAEGIQDHLQSDGLPVPSELTPAGFRHPHGEAPRCRRERARFLAGAPPMSVVIPTRERPERLRACVDSILASEYPSAQVRIVIADNAPRSDRTRMLANSLAEATDGRVSYVREDIPGSASARNRGLTVVETEVVAMTDDDVIVDRHWLTEIARAFAAHPEAGAVSGLLWPTELETPAQIWFEQYGGFSRGFERRVFDLTANRPAGEPLYPWNAGLFGTGNNFAFRAATLRAIGGFDPALGNGTPALGGVDSEVLLRTILSGYQIIYEPRALAHHAHRSDYDGLRRQVYAYGAGLVAYYLKTVLAEPSFAVDFIRKLPAGLRWMLSPDAHINKHKQADYPSQLTWIERRGMAYGPVAYARSRRRYGAHPVYGKRRESVQR